MVISPINRVVDLVDNDGRTNSQGERRGGGIDGENGREQASAQSNSNPHEVEETLAVASRQLFTPVKAVIDRHELRKEAASHSVEGEYRNIHFTVFRCLTGPPAVPLALI